MVTYINEVNNNIKQICSGIDKLKVKYTNITLAASKGHVRYYVDGTSNTKIISFSFHVKLTDEIYNLMKKLVTNVSYTSLPLIDGRLLYDSNRWELFYINEPKTIHVNKEIFHVYRKNEQFNKVYNVLLENGIVNCEKDIVNCKFEKLYIDTWEDIEPEDENIILCIRDVRTTCLSSDTNFVKLLILEQDFEQNKEVLEKIFTYIE